MTAWFGIRRSVPALAALALALGGCAMGTGSKGTATGAATVQLSGGQEVPPVQTSASGISTITVSPDGAVSGSVRTTGLSATAAHIHVGAPGTNGPVLIPLVKTAEGEWAVQPGTRLTEEQMRRYKAGELYVNVHTEAHKGGELRAQIKP